MSKKVFIISGNGDYHRMFQERGWDYTKNLEEADLVQFTGGEDVSPNMYGEKKHPKTGNNQMRDTVEAQWFNKALEMGIPMAGICRGGQFLNVMNGGRMFQHVDRHGAPHFAELPGIDKKVYVSSTHHQMMRPNAAREHIILLSARESNKKEWMGINGIINEVAPLSDDVESVYYPETNCLCFQPHPEFNAEALDRCRDVYFFFINNYLLPNVTVSKAKELLKEIPLD